MEGVGIVPLVAETALYLGLSLLHEAEGGPLLPPLALHLPRAQPHHALVVALRGRPIHHLPLPREFPLHHLSEMSLVGAVAGLAGGGQVLPEADEVSVGVDGEVPARLRQLSAGFFAAGSKNGVPRILHDLLGIGRQPLRNVQVISASGNAVCSVC
jgi:hypothetical protein